MSRKTISGSGGAARGGKFQSTTIRYYEQYLKGSREFEGWAGKQRQEAAMDAWEAEHGAAYHAEQQREQEDHGAAAQV